MSDSAAFFGCMFAQGHSWQVQHVASAYFRDGKALGKLLDHAREEGAREDGGRAGSFPKSLLPLCRESDAVKHGEVRLCFAHRVGSVVECGIENIWCFVRVGGKCDYVINDVEPLSARLLNLRRVGNYHGQTTRRDSGYGMREQARWVQHGNVRAKRHGKLARAPHHDA